ncbi:N-6 DNA methylase [Actinoallomurus liliacearum]|uniref:N-6 DNA methylase n=1 Tax=Actinoallomurus liliacearum TaxID=1080073 RepID=UPI0031F1BACC
MSKAEIAKAAGVRRPAVNNWEKRHADFPRPVDEGDRYEVEAMARWLMRRPIPANVLRPGEPAGSTYGERFARSIGLIPQTENPEPAQTSARAAVRSAADSAWEPPRDLLPNLEKWRGEGGDPESYEELLLVLLHLRCHDPRLWGSLVRAARPAAPLPFGTVLARALVEHQQRYPVVRDAVGNVGLKIWTDRQLAEVVRILEDVCAGERRDVPSTMTRAAVVCRALLDGFATDDRVRGGEFHTPDSIVRLAVRLLAPRPGDRVYDPACGDGAFLAGAAARIEERGGTSRSRSFGGQTMSVRSLRMAALNLAIHNLTTVTELRRGSALREDPSRTGKSDVIFANPPFNMRDWSRRDPTDDPRWRRFGPPPRHNANYGWLQYAVAKLSPRGRAAVLMPNTAAVSANTHEHGIRRKMVEQGVVDCLIMLPEQLFRSTPVPVTLWLLRSRPSDDSHHVLFIDARALGIKVDRKHRVLRPEDIDKITETYEEWRRVGPAYTGDAGFAAVASAATIVDRACSLAASRYVTAEPSSDPYAEEKVRRLPEELQKLHRRAAEVDALVDDRVSEVLR